MTKVQKEYIEKHIDLIEDKDWEKFFTQAPSGVGVLLYEAGVNFLKDVSEIVSIMFNFSGLTELFIPNNITNIGSRAFYDCCSLRSINIPNSVKSIGDQAFLNCTSLPSLTIGNSVTSIGSYAFQHCVSLTSVTIPDSITSIGEGAFGGCKSINEIKYNGTVAQLKASRLHVRTAWRVDSSISKIICTDGIINLRPLN